jgi:hypothetical protein
MKIPIDIRIRTRYILYDIWWFVRYGGNKKTPTVVKNKLLMRNVEDMRLELDQMLYFGIDNMGKRDLHWIYSRRKRVDKIEKKLFEREI